MQFLLGTHEPSWLRRTSAPLFVSYSRLRRNQSLPRAKATWALDSGAFSQLTTTGRWTIPEREYAQAVQAISKVVGRLQWASIQDWLCAPRVLSATGLTIKAHQKLTVKSLCSLRLIAPDVRWIPILQGREIRSYLDHLRAYRAEGFDFESEPIVGVCSLVNRYNSPEFRKLLQELHGRGLKLHAFGLSTIALRTVHPYIASADSLTWSFIARRRRIKHRHCLARHATCNNCLSYALAWRRELLSACGT